VTILGGAVLLYVLLMVSKKVNHPYFIEPIQMQLNGYKKQITKPDNNYVCLQSFNSRKTCTLGSRIRSSAS